MAKAQQYGGYPVDKIQTSSPNKINRSQIPSTTSAVGGYISSNNNKYSSNYNNNVSYQSHGGYKSVSTTNNSMKYAALSTNTNTNYLRGVVIAAPQNEKEHGWIYCKSTNNMYQLQFSSTKRYIPQQIVLFTPSSYI